MAGRTIQGVYKFATNNFADQRQRTKAAENFSKDLGGVVFYGALAANLIPGSAVLGASIFTVYSLIRGGKKNAYYTSKAIHNTAKFIWEGTGKSLAFIRDHVFTPFWTHILDPILRTIVDIVSAVFTNIVWPIVSNMGNCLGAILPKQPVWWGVAALVTAIFVYRGIPALARA